MLVITGGLIASACLDTDEVATSTETADVSVMWTNIVNVAATGDGLTKTATGVGWTAGAVSVETLASDGYVEFTTAENTTTKALGLSNGDAGQAPDDIDFAIRLRADGTAGIYERGVSVANAGGAYAAGDVFSVETRRGAIVYRKNGVHLLTHVTAATFPLRVDTALYSPGATLRDVDLVPTSISWQNVVGVSAAGNDLRKTATTNNWTAGASSVETLTGDGFAEMVAGDNTAAKVAGLSNGDASQHYADVDFAIRLGQDGVAKVFEGGVLVRIAGPYLAGDRFRIEVTGGGVTYSKNGARPFYTSTAAPTFPLRIDTAFLTPGGRIDDLTLVAAHRACPTPDGTGLSCGSHFVVESAMDLAAIDECVIIKGDLTIRGAGLVDVALPALERVGGTVTVQGAPDLRELRLPALQVASNVVVEHLATEALQVDLSRLVTVSDRLDVFGVPEVPLPCLDSTASLTAQQDAPLPASVYAPRLREVPDWIMARINAPALESAGQLFAAQIVAPVLQVVTSVDQSELVAPALRRIRADATESVVVAPSLTVIGGKLHLLPGYDLPALERVGSLSFGTVAPNLPALREVRGRLNEVCHPGTPSFSAVSFPSLEHAGSVKLCWHELTIDLPRLAVVDDLLEIRSNRVPLLQLPALTHVGGDLLLVSPSNLPALTTVDGTLRVHKPMSTPVLTTVGSAVVGTSWTAPRLAQVAEYLSLHSDQTIVFEAPALTHIGNSLLASHSDGIMTVNLPVVTTIGGSVSVVWNPNLTSIAFPLLTQLGGTLNIRFNASLPDCYVTNLLAQLQAAGWMGEVHIEGNTGTGTCP